MFISIATSLSLKALSQINPGSDLLPKAARWLVKNRRNGYYWLSTKETAFAIYGLTDYLKVSKELAPDYTYEVYLNGVKVAGQHVGASEATNAQSTVIDKKGDEVGASNQIKIVAWGGASIHDRANTLPLTTTCRPNSRSEDHGVSASGGDRKMRTAKRAGRSSR